MAAKKRKGKKAARARPRAPKRPVSLYYPKPDEAPGRVRVEPPKIPQPSSPIDIAPPPSLSRVDEPKKKPRHDAALSVAAAAALSVCIALFFHYVVGLDAVFTLALSLPFFIGLSILFYNFLELSERTGAR